MQRLLIFIAGFLISLASAGAETIGNSEKRLTGQQSGTEALSHITLDSEGPAGKAEITTDAPVHLVQSLPTACSKNEACYEKVTPPWTTRWCPKGSGNFDVFLIFNNVTVHVTPRSCVGDVPGNCDQYCASK